MKKVILVLSILLLVGAGGWFVMNRDNDENSIKNSNGNTQITENPEEKDTTPANTDPTEGGKYFVIKEWGVRFPVPEDYENDIEYGFFTSTNNEEYAYFASKKLSTKSTYGTCSLQKASNDEGIGIRGGSIAMSRTTDHSSPTATKKDPKVGDYWYSLGVSNGGACYEGDTGKEKSAFQDAITQSYQKLESYK